MRPCQCRNASDLAAIIPNPRLKLMDQVRAVMRSTNSPGRGKEKIALGKGPTAAVANRITNLNPTLHDLPCRPAGSARQIMKSGDIHYCSVTQGGASLALGYYLSPLRGFRLGSLGEQRQCT